MIAVLCASLLLGALPQLAPGPVFGPPMLTYGPPERLLVAQLRDKAPEIFAALEAPRCETPEDKQGSASARHTACLRLRGSLDAPATPWHEVARLYDPRHPHWPDDWSWPKTSLQHATMWLRLGKRADNRQVRKHAGNEGTAVRARFVDDLRCYGTTLKHGADGHLVLLAAAANADEGVAARMLWLLELRAMHPRVTCKLATMPRAHPLLRVMSRSKDEAVWRPAMRMLDQAMRHGAGDRSLVDWIVPEALAILAEPEPELSFADSNASLGGPYDNPATRESLIVSIASQVGSAAPTDAVLRYCKPFLENPSFGNRTDDFAWKLAAQIAPQLEARDQRWIRKRLADLADSEAGKWLRQDVANRLDGKAIATFELPEPDLSPVTHDVDPDEVTRDLERIAQRKQIGTDDHEPLRLAMHSERPAHRIRALQLCRTIPVWSPELEARILCESTNEDVAIRTAAYRTLATRDRKIWPCAWVVHEVAFDPAPSVRALLDELTR